MSIRTVVAAVCISALLPQQPRFRAGTDTVAVYATVTRSDGRLQPALRREDFRLFVDGRPVAISTFSSDPQPITAVLMLDMSSSVEPGLLWIRAAAEAFVDALAPVDRVSIGSFGREVAVSPHLTGDKTLLKKVVRDELWPGGSTPLWHGVNAAISSLTKESGRRVVVVVTDGQDAPAESVPKIDLGPLKRRTIDGGFLIYAIGVPQRGLADAIRDLARETGGGYIALSHDQELKGALQAVADELRHQYVLGFVPARLDRDEHRVRLETTDSSLRVRAPQRYRLRNDGR